MPNSRSCWSRALLAALMVVGALTQAAWALDVPLTVKEVAGVGATGYPVTAVVPVPAGVYQDAQRFRVVGADGAVVPAQVEVLNRWWGKDNSVRHVLVHFQPTVGAFGGPGTGQASYRLRDDGPGPGPVQPVTVSETGTTITLETGAATLTIQKAPFQIMTPAGAVEATFAGRTAVQKSFERTDVTVTIEERGPMRAVIRAEAPTLYTDAAHHTHGWAVRVYVYAGKPWVKVDYQLQNSAKTKVFAAPLYFQSLSLSRPGGVPVTVRYGTELGSAVTATAVGLIPAVGAWVNGLYWLDDMRHVVFETMYWFGGAAVPETFQFPPVAMLPTSWYASTKATLDLGGIVPTVPASAKTDRRQPGPVDAAHLGWDNFYLDLDRKLTPEMAGGLAYSGSAWIATEDPADVYEAERFALGELNVRPQWMAQYVHERDWPALQLARIGGLNFRKYDSGAGGWKLDSPYLAGTGLRAQPRDDNHGWWYHVEEYYYATGNLWVKDWLTFMGEMSKVFLHRLDVWPNGFSRGMGHSLSSAMMAYRVTGDASLLAGATPHKWITDLRADLARFTTGGRNSNSNWFPGSGETPRDSVFEVGYLTRGLINYLTELPGDPHQVMALLRSLMLWNTGGGPTNARANFDYWVAVDDPNLNGRSNGTATTMADPQAWYGLHGNPAALTHLAAYMDTGINGGEKPYGDHALWVGGFVGRVTKHWRDGAVSSPPAPTVTLAANPSSVQAGSSSTLTWSSTNATACTASGAWAGAKATNGSEERANLQATAGYTLTCTGVGGSAAQTATITVTSQPPPPPTGCTDSTKFKGEYFTNRTLSGTPKIVRCDDRIDFDWGAGSPAPEIPIDNFSVRWTKTVTLAAGTYTFTTVSNDGVRLFVDDVRIINNWSNNAVTATNTASRTLAGNHTIRMHFYDRTGVAEARLSWTGATPPAPTVSLSAAPLSVQSGGSSTLTWSSTGATSCTASGGWSGSKALAGTETQTSLTTTLTYTLGCTGAGGSATQSTTVTVGTPPLFTPNPALDIPANAAKDLGVFMCDQPTDQPIGCEYVTDYSGFRYDPYFHRMLMFGGGHGPAIATSLYTFNPNTLAWTALYQSTLVSDMTAANKDPDRGTWINTQQPIVRHTYNMLVVGDWGGSLGKRLVMMTSGGMDFPTGGVNDTKIAHYDLAKPQTGSYTQDGRWTFMATSASRPWYYAAASAVDPVSKKILIVGPNNQAGAGGLWAYDLTTDSTVWGASQPSGLRLGADHMVYFPPNDKFYYFRMSGAPQVLEITFDRANPANSTIVEVSGITGTGPSSNRETAYAYDSKNQLIGGAIENGNFHAYNPLTKTWTRRAMQPMSGDPIGDVAFHALDYDPVNNVYIILTESRRTWAYRWQ